jgi:peroxiredoxin
MNGKILLVVLTLFLVPVWSMANENKAVNEPLPELILEIPVAEYDIAYLGVSGKPGDEFKLSDIEADILVIELFSMYCPYCQQEAPLVNELYEKMNLATKKGVRVKMIGIGASNSQFEVDHFRENYNVPFPMFPDKDLSMYRALAGEGTPGFVGVRLSGEDAPKIILRNSGGFYSADDFLADLIAKSGI